MTRRAALAVTWTILAIASARSVSAAERTVTTIAGSGLPGARDGAATHASFYAPFAVAFARDGTSYVADAAGQRVRRIAKGIVTTLAGGGAPNASGLGVPGGYADGPGAVARFDRPTGLAVGSDGSVYVADSLNHCIRRIAEGKVTTFAGAPSRSVAADGPRATAGFAFPRALAFDDDRNLYVADFGAGIRKIAPDGRVSSLPLPSIPLTFTGIAATGAGPTLTLYAANMQSVGVYTAASGAWGFYTQTESDGPFGNPYGIAAVDAAHAVFTDVRSQNVYVFRAPTKIVGPYTQVIAGPGFDDPDVAAGYRDGEAPSARFFAPAGVAIRDGAAVVADAGNRRIRSIVMPSLRLPVRDVSELAAPPGAYRIALVSNSYAFWSTLWDDSQGGILERRLREAAPRVGLTSDPHVAIVRLDGATTSATAAYVRDVLADDVVDFVVFEIDIAHVLRDLAVQPALATGDAWIPAVAARLGEMARALGPRRMLVVVQPMPGDAAPAEAYDTQITAHRSDAFPALVDLDRGLLQAARSSRVPTLDLVTPIRAYEATAGRRALMQSDGDHLTRFGNAFVGEAIVREVERLRPWSTP